MQFWCAPSDRAWTWAWTAYPGVWLFLAVLAVVFWRWNRAGARASGRAAPPLHPLTVVGLVVLWIALDWPVGALGAGYLASVHMVQFLLIGLIAPPALLAGVTPDAARWLDQSRAGGPLRVLTRPVVAGLLLNVIVLLTHMPPIVDGLMGRELPPLLSQLGSMSIDLLWLVGGLLFWWPVIVPAPERPRFTPPLRMLYLVLALMFSPVMFGLVGFMVYAERPLYGIYELAPPFAGFSSRDDHQLAGVLMSLTGAGVAFVGLSVIFFRWNQTEG